MLFKRLTVCGFAMLTISQAAAQIELPPDEVDKHRTNMLITKINQYVSRIVPRMIAGIPPEMKCFVMFPRKNEQPAFSIERNRTPVRINLPHHFDSWAFRAETIFPFVHTYLSARVGSRAPLNDVWITAGIISDLYDTGLLYGSAGFRYTPYARAMLAHGYAPSLQNILDSRMADFYEQFHSSARMEWCSLLLKHTARKTNSFEQLLFRNRKLKPSERFEKILLADKTAQKGKTFFGKQGQTSQEWFVSACTRTVLGRGIPASVPLIEESFNNIVDPIRPFLKVPEIKKGKTTPVLSNEAVKALVQAEMKLNFLAQISPELVALKLYSYSAELRNFRLSVPTKAAIQKIYAEEKEVYTALSERAAVEEMLKQAERRLITPGMRFALTLQVVAPMPPDIPILKRAHTLMDRYE